MLGDEVPHDFVTSADDLLKQFENTSTSDFVSFRILFSTDQTVESALAARKRVLSFIDRELENFVWHRSPLTLSVVVDTSFPAISLVGSVNFGDCIDDEWLVVYILWEISKLNLDFLICTSDGDGEYLLIEAADDIPSWATPDNSQNRVWIVQGKLHLISPSDTPAYFEGGLPIDYAYRLLTRRLGDFVADEHVQRAISQRIDDYPGRAMANKHTVIATVPRDVARVLHARPTLVSAAVQAFCQPNFVGTSTAKSPIIGRKRGRKLIKFAPPTAVDSMSDDTAEKGHLFESPTPPNREVITLPIQVTRALFAEISFPPFHTPRQYHALWKSCIQKVADTGDAMTHTTRALDIGCRLTYGLEAAYQGSVFSSSGSNSNSGSPSKHSSQDSEGCIARAIGQLVKLSVPIVDGVVGDSCNRPDDPSGTVGESSQRNTHRLCTEKHPWLRDALIRGSLVVLLNGEDRDRLLRGEVAVESSVTGGSDGGNRGATEPMHTQIDRTLHLYSDVGDTDADGALSCVTLAQGTYSGGDDDAWLYMRPEEFEAELHERTKQYRAQHSSGGGTVRRDDIPDSVGSNGATLSHDQAATTVVDGEKGGDVESLQALLENVTGFFSSSSAAEAVASVEGIENRQFEGHIGVDIEDPSTTEASPNIARIPGATKRADGGANIPGNWTGMPGVEIPSMARDSHDALPAIRAEKPVWVHVPSLRTLLGTSSVAPREEEGGISCSTEGKDEECVFDYSIVKRIVKEAQESIATALSKAQPLQKRHQTAEQQSSSSDKPPPPPSASGSVSASGVGTFMLRPCDGEAQFVVKDDIDWDSDDIDPNREVKEDKELMGEVNEFVNCLRGLIVVMFATQFLSRYAVESKSRTWKDRLIENKFFRVCASSTVLSIVIITVLYATGLYDMLFWDGGGGGGGTNSASV